MNWQDLIQVPSENVLATGTTSDNIFFMTIQEHFIACCICRDCTAIYVHAVTIHHGGCINLLCITLRVTVSQSLQTLNIILFLTAKNILSCKERKTFFFGMKETLFCNCSNATEKLCLIFLQHKEPG